MMFKVRRNNIEWERVIIRSLVEHRLRRFRMIARLWVGALMGEEEKEKASEPHKHIR